MRLVSPEKISEIDKYAIQTLGIGASELMRRSADAVVSALESELTSIDGKIAILAGSGNNGGDGYAAALMLAEKYSVEIFDIFGAGQRTAEGKLYLEKCLARGIPITVYQNTEQINKRISSSAVIIDAILGAGARLPLSDTLRGICRLISASDAFKLAIDVPLGVDPKTAEAAPETPHYTMTVSLSYVKAGLVSYPAAAYVGRLVSSDIGLGSLADRIAGDEYALVDAELAAQLIPKRENNTNKGSFGKCALLVGSEKYRGAALLALESALRFGAGYVTLYAEKEHFSELLGAFPEAIFSERAAFSDMTERDTEKLSLALSRHSAILIGSGTDASAGLEMLTRTLVCTQGAPLVIDAGAINALAEKPAAASDLLKRAKRKIILTPHPLEFARLIGASADEVQRSRLTLAQDFAKKHGVILVLKGAATVITDGKRTYINSSGSSALAKAGSGDCLAGALASVIASAPGRELELCALTAYIHGAAGDSLEKIYSALGVTPSDLPKEMARKLREAQVNA